MSHEIETMFSVREKPWHALGTVLEDYPGREAAMHFAGHDWAIMECPVMAGVGEDGETVELPDHKALIRNDNFNCIGVVKKSYTVVSNDVLWNIIDSIVDADSNIKYETAGVLKGGSVLWVLARLDEPMMIGGDDTPTYPYVLVHTSHDYSKSTQCACVATRVVCWNTLNMAIKEYSKSGLSYTFKHTRNVMERIEEAKVALSSVRSQFEVYTELSKELCRHRVDQEGVADFINTLIPEPPADIVTDRGIKSIHKARTKVLSIVEGPTIPDDHKRTSYGMFCAGIEYLDHYRSAKSEESYFRRSVYETTTAKSKVMSLALSVAKN